MPNNANTSQQKQNWRHLRPEDLDQARCEGYRQTLKNREERLAMVNTYDTEAITSTELLRNEGDPYRAVVERKRELTGQILTLEDKIDRECPPENVIFLDPAPDALRESAYEDQQNGGYGEE